MDSSIRTIFRRQSEASQTGAPAIALLFASLSLGWLFRDRARRKRRGTAPRRPPYAPGGVWAHTKRRLSGKSQPYWFLDVATELGTRVFQLSLPSCPPTTLTAVGEAAACRAILTDPRTTKPVKIYSYFRKLYADTPTMFTSNGPEWHGRRKAVAPAFAARHVRRMTDVALEMTDAWMRDALRGAEGEGCSFDVGEQMVNIVLSALSETAFEYEMSAEEKGQFTEELELATVEFVRKTPAIPLRGALGWLVPERRRAVAAAHKLQALVLKIMKSYKSKGPVHEGTLIQIIMESEAFPTEEDKAAQLLEFLVAGELILDVCKLAHSWFCAHSL